VRLHPFINRLTNTYVFGDLPASVT